MFPKQDKIRSKKITRSASGENCSLRIQGICNHRQATTVFAHLPGNKGTATKNHDLIGVYACVFCHQHLDNGKVSAEDKLRAFQETLLKLVDKGLIEVK